MFEYDTNAVQGLLELRNLLTFLATVNKQGYAHKFTIPETKFKDLIDLGKKFNPDGLIEIPTLSTQLTVPVISTIQGFINNITTPQLTNLKTIVTDSNAQNFISKYVCLKCLGLLDAVSTITLITDTRIQFVLNNLTINTWPTLIDINNLINYLGFLNISLPNMTSILNNIFSLNLQELNLTDLAMYMPNFASFTSVLNLTYLTGIINLTNLQCNPYLTQFFSEYATTKTNVMSFVNDTLADFNLDSLTQSIAQFNSLIDNVTNELNTYTVIFDNVTTVIDDFETNFNQFLIDHGFSASCTQGIAKKLDGLKGFKTMVQDQFITPRINALKNYKLQTGIITDAVNSVNQLKLDLPSFDC